METIGGEGGRSRTRPGNGFTGSFSIQDQFKQAALKDILIDLFKDFKKMGKLDDGK